MKTAEQLGLTNRAHAGLIDLSKDLRSGNWPFFRGFNMAHISNIRNFTHEHCIFGHLATKLNYDLDFVSVDALFRKNTPDEMVYNLYDLFLPVAIPVPKWEEITRTMAADALDAYLEFGKANWEYTKQRLAPIELVEALPLGRQRYVESRLDTMHPLFVLRRGDLVRLNSSIGSGVKSEMISTLLVRHERASA